MRASSANTERALLTRDDAVLVDMNGVIVDDEHIHEEAFRQALQRFDLSLSPEDYARMFVGRRDEDALDTLPEAAGLTAQDRADLLTLKRSAYSDLTRAGLEPCAGAIEFIRAVSQAGMLLGLVTSSPRKEADLVIDALDLSGVFACRICAEDVARGKPDPEPYARAVSAIGRPTASCVVIEDAPAGIHAASQAGLRIIAVTTTHPADKLQSADRVVDRLSPDLLDI